jgi:hypothetical protein
MTRISARIADVQDEILQRYRLPNPLGMFSVGSRIGHFFKEWSSCKRNLNILCLTRETKVVKHHVSDK